MAKKSKNNKIDYDLIDQFRRSLEDIKHSRITEWKPKKIKK